MIQIAICTDLGVEVYYVTKDGSEKVHFIPFD